MAARFNLASDAFFQDPVGTVARARAKGPVVPAKFPLIGDVWITTTYEATARVLKDAAAFPLRKNGVVAGLRWWMPKSITVFANNMLTSDEPDHTRLRGLVDEAFRRRAVLGMEPNISAIADELAGQLFAEGTPADLVMRYTRILPLSVICELLGLPLADRPTFIGWANMLATFTSPIGFVRTVGAMKKMRRYMEERLKIARERGGEGLIAELARLEKEGGRISHDELVTMLFLLLIAGSETTTHLISGAVFELLKEPARRDWLEADWSRAGLAVEEFLRFVSPVQVSKPRFVREDMELEGVRLKKGDRIMALIVAANFDSAANDHPETLELDRHPNRHLAFGTGSHFCLGHQLARIEAVCGLRALFTRYPKLRLAVEPSAIRWRKRPGLRAIDKLPVAA
jgi:cytochrome P450 PksS